MSIADWRYAAAAMVVMAWLLNGPQAQAQTPAGSPFKLNPADLQELHKLSKVPLEDLEEMPPKAIAKVFRRLRYPQIQAMRAGYGALQYGISSAGDLPATVAQPQPPPGARWRAAEEFIKLQRMARRTQAAGIPVGVPGAARGIAGIDKEGWQWLGPGNVGGRTRAIVIHTVEPNTMWAGSVGGGVWRTDDGGQSWRPLENSLSNSSVTCLVIMPDNSETLLAGTGEHLGSGGGGDLKGDGIFITRDGGQNWQHLDATEGEEFDYVAELAVSSDGKVLLAATSHGLFRSLDFGTSWRQTLEINAADVHFHPADPTQAIVGAYDTGKAYFSANAGESWTPSDLKQPTIQRDGRVELCYAVADPQVVYALVNGERGVVFRSADGGRSFAEQSRPSQVFGPYSQGQYDNAIWAGDPTDANFVVIGGINLYKSRDAGATFQLISKWHLPASVHSDHHAIVSHPGYDGETNRVVFFGNDGGIYKAEDMATTGSDSRCTQGWVKLNNGYGVTQFYDAAGDPETGIIIAGAQDNGTLRYRPQDGPQNWKTIWGGDGGYCAIDPQNPNVFYGEYVFLEIFRKTDGGESEDGATLNGMDLSLRGPSALPGQGVSWKSRPYQLPDSRAEMIPGSGRKWCNFIAPFLLDPNDSSRMLAGGASLWLSTDPTAPVTETDGPAWTAIKPPMEPLPRRFTSNEQYRHFESNLISTLAVGEGDSDVVWVGHNGGAIYKSTNATAAKPEWQRVGEGVLPDRWCQGLTISPHDHRRVYAGFVDFDRDNLWMTNDGGETWENVGAKLPPGGVRGIAVHPSMPDWVYIGTDAGVLASDDGGTTFTPVDHGPALCRITELFWMNEKLIAVTYGRGVYSIEAKLPDE